jgi:acetyl-CoA acetyltransferase
VQLYDAFTNMPIILLEDLGFCAKGDGGPFIASGATLPGGELPMNTQGGGLSHCHPGMYGIFLVIEAVRQLRGECGSRQVESVLNALCHGAGGGGFGSHATMVLGRL